MQVYKIKKREGKKDCMIKDPFSLETRPRHFTPNRSLDLTQKENTEIRFEPL